MRILNQQTPLTTPPATPWACAASSLSSTTSPSGRGGVNLAWRSSRRLAESVFVGKSHGDWISMVAGEF